MQSSHHPSDEPKFQQKRGYAEREITRMLIQAIFEQRLPPGARITEEQLAEAFNVSRTIVRQSMNRLSEMGVFKKTPNQGCTIAAPTRHEARRMLEVRLLLEPSIAQLAAENWKPSDIAHLRAHLTKEDAARRAGDRSTLVRLTGEFHLIIAEVTGNPYLVRIMTELQVLTCLAVLVHAERETGCPKDEHSLIVDAIERRDGKAAAERMIQHLRHIAKELQLDRDEPELSIERAFHWMNERSSTKN